jgi:hypothetical protein
MPTVRPERTMTCGNVVGAVSGMKEVVDGWVRRIDFEPGYDCWTNPCPQRHGQHGMNLRFILAGEEGAVQFLMYTGDWVPGAINDIGHLDRSRRLHGPMAADLGHHWLRPVWEGEESQDNCEYLMGAPCFYDGSGLNAGPVLARFFKDGADGVWAELEDYYRLCAEEAGKVAQG